jgi:hypothetical protein
MTGSISNPSIGVNLKEVAGDAIKELETQVKDFAQAKLDSAKQKVKDSLQAVKEKITDKVKDKLKEQIFGKDTTVAPANPQDTASKKPKTDIKKSIKDLFLKPKKPATDTVKQ